MDDTQRARLLRKKETWAEQLVWRWLRDRRFNGYKFRRQHPEGVYYLDFYCREAHCILELRFVDYKWLVAKFFGRKPLPIRRSSVVQPKLIHPAC